ncbi:MAG: hypothetical protein H6807_00190 [Planctomycetes bacterium]|nr:hypothetical protein [Planctomycetota bacterium]
MSSRMTLLLALICALGAAGGCAKKLRDRIDDQVAAERWIYDDYEAALARARTERKPLFVLFRCVP